MEKTIPVSKADLQCLSIPSINPLVNYLNKEYPDNHYQLNTVSFSNSTHMVDCCAPMPTVTLPLDQKEQDGIAEMMNTFLQDSEPAMDCFALAAPFSKEIVFSTDRYEQLATSEMTISALAGMTDYLQTSLEVIYQLIIEKFYGLSLVHKHTFNYKITAHEKVLETHIEFELVTDLIDVTANTDLPTLSDEQLTSFFGELHENNILLHRLPLKSFTLEGLMLIKVRDITMKECSKLISNTLQTMPYMGEPKSFKNLQKQLRNITGLEELRTSILLAKQTTDDSLQELGDEEILSGPLHYISRVSERWARLEQLFSKRNALHVTASTGNLHQFPFLQSYVNNGAKNIALFALRSGAGLSGVFLVLNNDQSFKAHHMHKLEQIIPLLEMAMENQTEKMDDEIDRVIKEQFTAVQSSVNWKFTQAARNYILDKNNGYDSKIENIVFENVFPLYGSIDVRNSSIERSTAIQKDLYEQLQLAASIIRKCKSEVYLFSLQEIGYRIDKYLAIASTVLFPGDELTIQGFLDDEIIELFNHLKQAVPAVRDDIDNYLLLLNCNNNKISKQCTAFEESIALINNELVKFINQEQLKVQEIYAHYFEYFVTDGVDFNIYIGQSITPQKLFDQFYLRNLKLWQITTLVKAAKKIRNLQYQLPVALDTTQLILAHSKPLSISFRVAERKFDVDGAYNIHYEIIKKRIDKIKILGSCERLTQPGKIAIVFAHDKEAQEYTSYIEFLQQEGLLENTIEYFDLEELPGVRGLRALRVSIKMDAAEDTGSLLVGNYQLKAVS